MTVRCFEHAFGQSWLARRPLYANDPLQAWDAADELLLQTLQQTSPQPPARVLVINDAFGALAVAVPAGQRFSWSDSITAQLALRDNLARNDQAAAVTWIPATEAPTVPPAAVLWRIPKSIALLQQQLARLSPLLTPGTIVLAGGMDKHLPARLHELLAPLGSLERLPGRKKAHVYRVQVDPARAHPAEPVTAPLRVPEYDLALQGDANIFSRGQLDIGARFFLGQFPGLPPASRIADLGCGNGVLGIVAQRQQPAAAVAFFDDSFQAVACAEQNYDSNIGPRSGPAPAFVVDNGLSHYEGAPFDLVLCNPPFHQGHQVGDQIARQLFRQARATLAIGGELWVVGNRHLGYHIALRRLFGNCRTVAGNPKFVVLAARREARVRRG